MGDFWKSMERRRMVTGMDRGKHSAAGENRKRGGGTGLEWSDVDADTV